MNEKQLSIIAEHIKHRIFETVLNNSDEKIIALYSEIFDRIDIWIDELKDGDQ